MKKRTIHSLPVLMALILVLFASCKPTNPTDNPPGNGGTNPPDPPIITVDSLGISVSEVSFTAEKDASLIVVRTNTAWTASESSDWLSLSATSGNKNTGFLIGATKNATFKREATITIKAGDKTKEIKVTQTGALKITLKVKEVIFNLILVEGGQFTMGSSDNSSYGVPHQVALSDFYISETEVTNALWMAVRGTLPYTDHSETDFPEFPVSETTWDGIVSDFIPALNQLTGKNFNLPTEAQWEYAALGGKKTTGTRYAGSNTLDDVAWYSENSGDQKKAVKGKYPNQLGMYDMSGNVAEWCSDWHHKYYGFSIENGVLVVPSLQTDPTGPESGSQKIVRGGDFKSDEIWGFSYCHVKYRSSIHPSGYDRSGYYPDTFYSKNTGFRLVLTP